MKTMQKKPNMYMSEWRGTGGARLEYYVLRDEAGRVVDEGILPEDYFIAGGLIMGRARAKLAMVNPDAGLASVQLRGEALAVGKSEQQAQVAAFFDLNVPCPYPEWEDLRGAWVADLAAVGENCTTCVRGALVTQYRARLKQIPVAVKKNLSGEDVGLQVFYA